ncbi:hypothetical protein DPSP01_007693 [Paraphaeosphaeria sporulosa]
MSLCCVCVSGVHPCAAGSEAAQIQHPTCKAGPLVLQVKATETDRPTASSVEGGDPERYRWRIAHKPKPQPSLLGATPDPRS